MLGTSQLGMVLVPKELLVIVHCMLEVCREMKRLLKSANGYRKTGLNPYGAEAQSKLGVEIKTHYYKLLVKSKAERNIILRKATSGVFQTLGELRSAICQQRCKRPACSCQPQKRDV